MGGAVFSGRLSAAPVSSGKDSNVRVCSKERSIGVAAGSSGAAIDRLQALRISMQPIQNKKVIGLRENDFIFLPPSCW